MCVCVCVLVVDFVGPTKTTQNYVLHPLAPTLSPMNIALLALNSNLDSFT